jgi:hypothetical protein
MTTYRELLERLIVFADKKVDGLKVTNYQIYTPAGQQLVDDVRAYLAQPMTTCEAREAILVKAIESLRQDEEHFDEWCREVGECSPGCKRLTAALADTSLAACSSREGELVAALRAYTDDTEWHIREMGPVGTTHDKLLRNGLAALAQGKKE